jgi:rod shape-determining protein MreC
MSINHQARNASSARAASLSLRSTLQRAGAVLCLLFSLSLLVIGKFYPQWMQNARLTSATAVTELASIIARPLDAVQSFQQNAEEWSNALSENRRLRLELQAYSRAQAQLQELTAENTRLRALSSVATPQAPHFINARVISLAGGAAQQSLWINAGSEHGVQKDMAVMAPEGMVGRVLEVGPKRSRVLLLTDGLSRIPVQMGQSRFHAVASGQESSGMLAVRHLPPHAELEHGELVLTAGDGNLLPVGMPVGVIEVSFTQPQPGSDTATPVWRIRPLADLSRLDMLSVIQLPDAISAEETPAAQ